MQARAQLSGEDLERLRAAIELIEEAQHHLARGVGRDTSFWAGLGSALDLFGVLADPSAGQPNAALVDAMALRRDWSAVGRDFWTAFRRAA